MAIVRVNVKPELLRWACDRAGERGAKLRESVPHLGAWLAGEERPTLKQLEGFARKANVALGYLFLPSPPAEKLPIPDLRTVGGLGVRRPSPELLDVIHLCERRQEWYREYAILNGEEEKAFCGSAALDTAPEEVAREIQRVLQFGVTDRRAARSTDEAMRLFIDRAEAAGVLVMASGVVGTNTGRKLSVDEFRGFALADRVAPLVFVNTADAKAAQMFTLAHELAHIWLGQSGVTDAVVRKVADSRTEQWCNAVAAELLIPAAALRSLAAENPLENIAGYRSAFKVSGLVVLRRLLDVGLIDRREFDGGYALVSQPPRIKKAAKGGDFYNTFPRSVSKRFVRALYADTLEGNTTYREACRLLGIKKASSLVEVGKRVDAA